jgi:hypothetical protein
MTAPLMSPPPTFDPAPPLTTKAAMDDHDLATIRRHLRSVLRPQDLK